MTAPVIRQFVGSIPDKGQAQTTFDTNVDAFLDWQALQFAPDLVAFGTWASSIRETIGFTRLSNAASVLDDTTLAYSAAPGKTVIPVGSYVLTDAEGFSYQVAASAATDQHVTTAGGVKLYVQAGASGFNVVAFGAIGDGVINDSAVFTAIAAVLPGTVVDLAGKIYAANAVPTGNIYLNGEFLVDGLYFPAMKIRSVLSTVESRGDIGKTDGPNTGGTYVNPGPIGRSTNEQIGIIGSQRCHSEFVRAWNIASIDSAASGNVSINAAARLSLARCPQSANVATEEGQIFGFRGFNAGSIYIWSDYTTSGNIWSRLGRTNAEESGNIASNGCEVGRGYGARFTVTVAAGAVTTIAVVDGGQGYDAGNLPTMVFFDRKTLGIDATATATVNGSGVITAVTVNTGGSGYSDRTDVVAADLNARNGLNIASEASVVRGLQGLNAGGSNNFTGTGRNAGTYSSRRVSATGALSFVIGSGLESGGSGSGDSTASGVRSGVIGSGGSETTAEMSGVLFGNICRSTAVNAIAMGRRVENNVPRSIAGGSGASGAASTANRTWHLFDTGNVSIAGTLTSSAVFTDYAEYFENFENGVIPLGTLVSLTGRKVGPAQASDAVLGVVSATAAFAAGDSPFTWQGRYLTGEFGEALYHYIPDPDWVAMVPDMDWKLSVDEGEDSRPLIANPTPAQLVKVQQENPEYDPTIVNTPRSERSESWTCVGLLGQLHTRVDQTVCVGDFVMAGTDGIGTKSENPTSIVCMEIRSEYQADKGYGVGLCLVK